jgi:hypothetical protein
MIIIRCDSCGFGAGHRTGQVHCYRWISTGEEIDLCDDCVSKAPELVELHEWEI